MVNQNYEPESEFLFDATKSWSAVDYCRHADGKIAGSFT